MLITQLKEHLRMIRVRLAHRGDPSNWKFSEFPDSGTDEIIEVLKREEYLLLMEIEKLENC